MPPITTPTHEMQSLVDALYTQYLPHSDGEVATYIPELSTANPDDFGVCLITADGRVFEAGDCDREFTIQSISKPFTFGMAVEELGHDMVLQHVGRRTERGLVQFDRAARRDQPPVTTR